MWDCWDRWVELRRFVCNFWIVFVGELLRWITIFETPAFELRLCCCCCCQYCPQRRSCRWSRRCVTECPNSQWLVVAYPRQRNNLRGRCEPSRGERTLWRWFLKLAITSYEVNKHVRCKKMNFEKYQQAIDNDEFSKRIWTHHCSAPRPPRHPASPRCTFPFETDTPSDCTNELPDQQHLQRPRLRRYFPFASVDLPIASSRLPRPCRKSPGLRQTRWLRSERWRRGGARSGPVGSRRVVHRRRWGRCLRMTSWRCTWRWMRLLARLILGAIRLRCFFWLLY